MSKAKFPEGPKDMSEDIPSEIQEFYEGRSVFVTGGTGVIGGILLETLLRCCPGLTQIFILVRTKKGIAPEERRTRIFDKIIFHTLKKENPDAFKKVRAVSGDISKDGLGLSYSDLENLKENVSVVINCAASVSFLKPERYMVSQNAGGTQNIIQLCRKLPNFTALVHTSTAFSNSVLKEIKEKIYPFNLSAKRIIEECKSGNEEGLKALKNQLSVNYVNKYIFSKAVAENIIAEEAEDLPVAIVRPSVVTYCYKGPYSGYIEPGFFVGDIIFLITSGILKAIHLSPKLILDIIPGDVTVNTLIISAWAIATKRMSSPLIVNNCSSKIAPHTIHYLAQTAVSATQYMSVPWLLQTPHCVVTSNYWKFKLNEIIHHYIPGIALDLSLIVTGHKPKFIKMFAFIANMIYQYSNVENLEIFCDSENFLHLNTLLSKADKEIFNIDISELDTKEVVKNSLVPIQLKMFKNSKVEESKEVQFAIARRNAIILNFIKFIVISLFLILVVTLIQKLISNFV